MSDRFIDNRTGTIFLAMLGFRVKDGSIARKGGVLAFWDDASGQWKEIMEHLRGIDADRSPFRLESFA